MNSHHGSLSVKKGLFCVFVYWFFTNFIGGVLADFTLVFIKEQSMPGLEKISKKTTSFKFFVNFDYTIFKSSGIEFVRGLL